MLCCVVMCTLGIEESVLLACPRLFFESCIPSLLRCSFRSHFITSTIPSLLFLYLLFSSLLSIAIPRIPRHVVPLPFLHRLSIGST